jgi:hypothetical protein
MVSETDFQIMNYMGRGQPELCQGERFTEARKLAYIGKERVLLDDR